MIGFTTEDKVIDSQNDWSFKPKFSLDRYPEHNFIKGEEYLKQKYGSTYDPSYPILIFQMSRCLDFY